MLGSEQGPKSMVTAEEVVASKCWWQASRKVFRREEVKPMLRHISKTTSVAVCGSCGWCGRLEPHLSHLPFPSQLLVRSHIKFIFCLVVTVYNIWIHQLALQASMLASTKVSAGTKVCHLTSGGLDFQAWTPWKRGLVQSRVGIGWQEKEEGGTSSCNVSVVNSIFNYKCWHHLVDVGLGLVENRGCQSGGLLGMQWQRVEVKEQREVHNELTNVNSSKSFQTLLGDCLVFVCPVSIFNPNHHHFLALHPLRSPHYVILSDEEYEQPDIALGLH